MRKYLAIILIAVMCAGLVACGKENSKDNKKSSSLSESKASDSSDGKKESESSTIQDSSQSGIDSDGAYSYDADTLYNITSAAQKTCDDVEYEDYIKSGEVFKVKAENGKLVFIVEGNEKINEAWYMISDINGTVDLKGLYSEDDFSGAIIGKVSDSGLIEWTYEGTILSKLFEKVPSMKSKLFN